MKRSFPLIVLLFTLVVVPLVRAQNQPLKVIATTTIVADVAQNIAGDVFTVQSLLPPNTDTHAYEPTPNDAIAVAQADLLLTVGAGYESFLSTLLQNAGSGVKSFEVTDNVPILRFGGASADTGAAPEATATPGSEYLGVLGKDNFECAPFVDSGEAAAASTAEATADTHGICDPHTWMDPKNVEIWATNIAGVFAQADPTHADTYQANATAYIAQLEQLDKDVREILAPLPVDRRILVTNHDFLGYFAHAYDFTIVGNVIPSISSTSEPDPKQLATLIDVIAARHVAAIFVEVSSNPRQAQAIADEAHVRLVDTLYAEALSEPGTAGDTYIHFLKFDAQTIADALK